MCRDSGGSQVILLVLHMTLREVFQPKSRILVQLLNSQLHSLRKSENREK